MPTAKKKARKSRENESFNASFETWNKPATPEKSKTSTYMKNKVIDYAFIEDHMKNEKNSIVVSGRKPEDGTVPQLIRISRNRLDSILNLNEYIDSEIVDAALSLIDRKIAMGGSVMSNLNVYSISDIRLILIGETSLLKKGGYFIAIFPRKFAISEEAANIRALQSGESRSPVNCIHYTLVSNIHCESSEVNIFETLPAYRNVERLLTEEQKKVLKMLTNTENETLKVNCVNVFPQSESECGAICIALAAKLCFTAKEERSIFERFVNSREDLVSCLTSNDLISFKSLNIRSPLSFNEVLFSCSI